MTGEGAGSQGRTRTRSSERGSGGGGYDLPCENINEANSLIKNIKENWYIIAEFKKIKDEFLTLYIIISPLIPQPGMGNLHQSKGDIIISKRKHQTKPHHQTGCDGIFFSLFLSFSPGSLLILPEGVVVGIQIFAWAPKKK